MHYKQTHKLRSLQSKKPIDYWKYLNSRTDHVKGDNTDKESLHIKATSNNEPHEREKYRRW